MATITEQPRIELTVTFKLNEEEIRALDALVGYGVDSFLKVFYEHMGKHYLQPHEKGLRSLFESTRETIPQMLQRTKAARDSFSQKEA